MNNKDLIDAIAADTGVSLSDVEACLEATIANITKALSRSETVTLSDFGVFEVVRTEARLGRDPQTGKAFNLLARNVVKFTAGDVLKKSV